MSLLGQTLVLYAVLGAGVAVAVYLRGEAIGRLESSFRIASALVFWPLYVPMLLSRTDARGVAAMCFSQAPTDELALSIAQAESEVNAALESLRGWADNVLAAERGRIHEVREHWVRLARRIRDMDRLLALSDDPPQTQGKGIVSPDLVGVVREQGWNERLNQLREARLQSREQLKALRQRAADELMESLLLARQIASMVQLARFNGAPPTMAAELLARIATTTDVHDRAVPSMPM
jgi:hypothetical protein